VLAATQITFAQMHVIILTTSVRRNTHNVP
jgi:hypothetical protein